MKPILTTQEHYDFLAESGHGRDDPPFMNEYMARWDGSVFFDALGDVEGKDVLEIGVGSGRLARRVLDGGCSQFTGLDISPKTLEAAKKELAGSDGVELILADICEAVPPGAFDIAYSVLTFEHIEDKATALANVVTSLRSGGHFVLSVNLAEYRDTEGEDDWLDFGPHKVRLFRAAPEQYVCWLNELDCKIALWLDIRDVFVSPDGTKSKTYGQTVAALIKAVKR